METVSDLRLVSRISSFDDVVRGGEEAPVAA